MSIENIAFMKENFDSKSKKNKDSNRLLKNMLIISCILYLLFFTSKIWLPAPYEGVEVTPIGTAIEANDRTVTVDKWDYSKDDRKMEIAISIEDLSIDGITSYDWNVKTATEDLQVEPVIEKSDFVILEVTDVPRRWTEVALTMNLKDEDRDKGRASEFQEVKVYMNDKNVTNVKHIERRTFKEYKIDAYNSRIDQYKAEIRGLLEEKRSLQDEISAADRKIKELEGKMEYQTAEEQQKTFEKVTSIKDQKNSISMQLEDIEKKIEDRKERVNLQNELLQELAEK